MGGEAEIVGLDEIDARFVEDLAALLDVGAGQADDDGRLDPELAVRLDDPFGDDVGTGHAAEDVDEDGFDGGVEVDDVEGLDDAFDAVDGADIEEVGGLAARRA